MSLRFPGGLFATAVLAPLLVSVAAAQPYSPLSDAPPAGPASGAAGTTTPVHAVSLRAGPSGAAPIIGTLHPGTPLEVLGAANYGWVQVRSSAGTGWAYGSYLAGGFGEASRIQDRNLNGDASATSRIYGSEPAGGAGGMNSPDAGYPTSATGAAPAYGADSSARPSRIISP